MRKKLFYLSQLREVVDGLGPDATAQNIAAVLGVKRVQSVTKHLNGWHFTRFPSSLVNPPLKGAPYVYRLSVSGFVHQMRGCPYPTANASVAPVKKETWVTVTDLDLLKAIDDLDPSATVANVAATVGANPQYVTARLAALGAGVAPLVTRIAMVHISPVLKGPDLYRLTNTGFCRRHGKRC